MPLKHSAISGRPQFFRVDWRQIEIVEGRNPRSNFEDPDTIAHIKWLAGNIAINGVLEPVVLKKEKDGRLTVIDGECRIRGVRMAVEHGAKIDSIPAFIEKSTINEIDILLRSLNSNSGLRLKPVDEGRAYKKFVAWGKSIDSIAAQTGYSDTHIRNRIQLADAGPDLEMAINEKSVNLGDAKKIIDESGGDVGKQSQKTKAASIRPKLEKLSVAYSRSGFLMKRPNGNAKTVQAKEILTHDFLADLDRDGFDLSTMKLVVKRSAEDIA